MFRLDNIEEYDSEAIDWDEVNGEFNLAQLTDDDKARWLNYKKNVQDVLDALKKEHPEWKVPALRLKEINCALVDL